MTEELFSKEEIADIVQDSLDNEYISNEGMMKFYHKYVNLANEMTDFVNEDTTKRILASILKNSKKRTLLCNLIMSLEESNVSKLSLSTIINNLVEILTCQKTFS